MSIKAVFSDIDGTLLDSNHHISIETKRTIQRIVNAGIPFILVSARMPKGIIPLQKELDIESPMICYSGALVLDAADNNGNRPVLYSKGLQNQEAGHMYDLIRCHYPGISFNLYHDDCWIVNDPTNKWVKQEQAITGVNPIQEKINSYIEKGHTIHKILCMGDEKEIGHLEEHVKHNFQSIAIYKSKKTYLEIMDRSVSKSTAIQTLLKKQGILKQEIMALGDNFNDSDMLTFAGLGIAMGNAPIEVKKKADETTLTNDQEGVRHSLEKHIPITG